MQAALSAHLEEAAGFLQAELADGAEVPFELERRGGRPGARRPALFCYRPLVGDFLRERAESLEQLPTHRQAVIALADFDGLDRYLLDHGIEPGEAGPRGRLREGLLALMEDAFGEGDDFELAPERLQSALASLQASHRVGPQRGDGARAATWPGHRLARAGAGGRTRDRARGGASGAAARHGSELRDRGR